MPNNKGKCKWEEVFPDQMHELVVAESRIRCPHSKKDQGKKGCFDYEVGCGEFRECGDVGGTKEKSSGECIYE